MVALTHAPLTSDGRLINSWQLCATCSSGYLHLLFPYSSPCICLQLQVRMLRPPLFYLIERPQYRTLVIAPSGDFRKELILLGGELNFLQLFTQQQIWHRLHSQLSCTSWLRSSASSSPSICSLSLDAGLRSLSITAPLHSYSIFGCTGPVPWWWNPVSSLNSAVTCKSTHPKSDLALPKSMRVLIAQGLHPGLQCNEDSASVGFGRLHFHLHVSSIFRNLWMQGSV